MTEGTYCIAMRMVRGGGGRGEGVGGGGEPGGVAMAYIEKKLDLLNILKKLNQLCKWMYWNEIHNKKITLDDVN